MEYSDPVRYRSNPVMIVGLGLLLYAVTMFPPMFHSIIDSVLLTTVTYETGLLAVTTLPEFITLILTAFIVTVPVHESIHYLVGYVTGRNPKLALLDTPIYYTFIVVLDHDAISRKQMIAMLSTPFTVVSIIAVAGIIFTSSVVSQWFYWVLVINTVMSCADIYNTLTVFQTPKESLFSTGFTAIGQTYREIPVTTMDELRTTYRWPKENT